MIFGTCRGPGCQIRLETTRPFCLAHWSLIRPEERRTLWKAWLDPEAWKAALAHATELVAQRVRGREQRPGVGFRQPRGPDAEDLP